MADLIGIQIAGLSPAPSLNGTTELPIQRQGVDKAEKTNLQNLSSFLINSTAFSNYIDTNTSNKVQNHSSGTDPHGDRAFTSTLLQAHTTATDPHGDRAYTNTKVTSSINTHATAEDPHGDRASTTAQITAHGLAVDPHGDRAFASEQDIVTLNEAKIYADNLVTTKVTEVLGEEIAPIVDGKLPDTYLNKQVLFSEFSAFPLVGSSDVIYVDSVSNDIYRWSGITYTNLTPGADIGGLDLTTDDVLEGTNINRQYLTAALKEEYENKVSSVANKEELELFNNLVESTGSSEVTIRNIIAESDINLVLTQSGAISITDNIYKYSGITEDSESLSLSYSIESKSNVFDEMLNSTIYNINGEVACLAFEEANEVKYVTDNEKILVNTYVGMKGVLEEVVVPTDVLINSTGNVITGNAPLTKQVRAYNSSFTEIGLANTLADGSFTMSLSTAITNGSPIYIYTVDGVGRSKDVEIFAPNLGTVKEVSLISIDSTGLVVKGKAERNSTVTVYKDTTVEIGTGTSNIKGFFEITLTEPVVEDQELSIKTVNSFAKTRTDTYITNLSGLIAPYEVVVNYGRTNISGKAEPNSTISILVDMAVIDSVEVDSSGNFNKDIQLSSDISSILIFIEKEELEIALEYTTNYVLSPYLNEENKLKENLKITSSEFGVISSDTDNLGSKNNYKVFFEELNNKVEVKVQNTDSRKTKWLASFKITKIEL